MFQEFTKNHKQLNQLKTLESSPNSEPLRHSVPHKHFHTSCYFCFYHFHSKIYVQTVVKEN